MTAAAMFRKLIDPADPRRSAFWSGVWSALAIFVVAVAITLAGLCSVLMAIESAHTAAAEYETALRRAHRLTHLTEEQARALASHAPETLIETEQR